MDLEAAFEAYGLVAIALVLLVKAAGVPLPVPADVLMLITATRAAEGRLSLWQGFAAILLALVAGGIVQFLLARGPARSFLYRYGRYLGLTAARLDGAGGAVQRGGALAIGLAILTPGLRAAAVAACGLANVPLRSFLPGLALGSAAFVGAHFGLGYAGSQILGAVLALPLPVALAGSIALLVAGFAIWWLIRRRQRPAASGLEVAFDALEAWHEATCPACLLIGGVANVESMNGGPIPRAPLAAGD